MATILVTGASRGIGLALTRHYASRGDTVIAAARAPKTSTGLSALVANKAGNSKVEPIALEVTDEAQLKRLAETLAGRPIDIAICNAGIMSSRGGIEAAGHDAAEWQRVLMTNVAGVFLTARAVLPNLELANGGKLAVISSMMGSSRQATGDTLAYRVSKAAAANLGLNLSADLKSKGIAVGIYHPGWVSSDMGGSSAPVTPADSAAGLVDRIDRLSISTTGVFEDYRGQPYTF
jgi:NAD(P)-dependent dehydrogenase (short-subunit alcohol dehydrogenase family)